MEISFDISKKVSVIIPSYNHVKWISQSIESVLNQSYENLELIIVDDGSSDGSQDVLKRYADNPRVKVVINNFNVGQGYCIKKGLELAQGELICLLPSDDWYYSDAISLLVEKFETLSSDYGIVYGPTDRYIEGKSELRHSTRKLYRGDVKYQLINDWGFVSPMSPMYRKKVLLEFPMLEGYRAEGESIFFKIATRYYFDYITQTVGCMREHSYNTGSNHILMAEETIRWWKQYLRSDSASEFYIARRKDILGFLYRMYGLSVLKQHTEVRKARSLLMSAIHSNGKFAFDAKVIFAIFLSFLGESAVRYFYSTLWSKIEKIRRWPVQKSY